VFCAHFIKTLCVCVFLQSLVKSSWESRDRSTVIPQGVPYMVKLLRYYVSEDVVYLHLEHVKGELQDDGSAWWILRSECAPMSDPVCVSPPP